MCKKMKMGAVFGYGTSFNAKGSGALAEMVAEMAWKLDHAKDTIEDLKAELVTSRGNDV